MHVVKIMEGAEKPLFPPCIHTRIILNSITQLVYLCAVVWIVF